METIDEILEELRSGEFARLADRIEASIKNLIADRDNRRKQALAEDARANAWRKICADCQEGEPPKDCEYYGEPGGCNAPTMGKHPTCEKSSAVGNVAKCKELLGEVYVLLDKSKSYIVDVKSIDRRREFSHYLTRAKNLVDNMFSQELSANVRAGNAAKMREVLKSASERLRKATESEDFGEDVLYLVGCMRSVAKECDYALSAPARNCDVYATELERQIAFIDWYNEINEIKGSKDAIDICDLKHNVEDTLHDYIDWLFAEAKGVNK